MSEMPERDVLAPCNCILRVNHIRGERLAMCDHGRRWVIGAVQTVEYVFTERVA